MSKGNILVVEDDDSIRQLLMQYLKEHSGVTVHGARDGADALHQVSTHSYDLVVLDVMMPFMTGIDFLDSLQVLASSDSGKRLDRVPAVIVITGAPAEQIATHDITSRFPGIVRAVFRKPLDTERLEAEVRRALRASRN